MPTRKHFQSLRAITPSILASQVEPQVDAALDQLLAGDLESHVASARLHTLVLKAMFILQDIGISIGEQRAQDDASTPRRQ